MGSKIKKQQLENPKSRNMGAYGDLHVHSYGSFDGVYKIPDLIEMFKHAGLKIATITDHNTIMQLIKVYELYKKPLSNTFIDIGGLKFVPGTEVTCRVSSVPNKKNNSTKIHTLIFSPDLSPGCPLYELLGLKRRNDKDYDYGLLMHICRKKNIINLNNEEDKLKFEEEIRDFIVRKRRVEEGFSSFGVPHALEFLQEKGWFGTFVKSYKELFKLAETAPKFDRLDLEFEDVLKVAHASKALVIMAHPSTNLKRTNTPQELVEYLIRQGIDGFEIVGEKTKYRQMILKTVGEMETVNPIIYTGGSDFHDVRDGKLFGVKNNCIVTKGDILDFEDWLLAENESRKILGKSVRNWQVDIEKVSAIIAKYGKMLLSINEEASRVRTEREEFFAKMTPSQEMAWESTIPAKIAEMRKKKEDKTENTPQEIAPAKSEKSKPDNFKKKKKHDYSDEYDEEELKRFQASKSYQDYMAEMEEMYGEHQNYTFLLGDDE